MTFGLRERKTGQSRMGNRRTCCASRPGEYHSAKCALTRGVPNRKDDERPCCNSQFNAYHAAGCGKELDREHAYLMAQQGLLKYYAPEQVQIYKHGTAFNAQPWTADVQKTFENETRLNPRRARKSYPDDDWLF